jgi:hypothetical protein
MNEGLILGNLKVEYIEEVEKRAQPAAEIYTYTGATTHGAIAQKKNYGFGVLIGKANTPRHDTEPTPDERKEEPEHNTEPQLDSEHKKLPE